MALIFLPYLVLNQSNISQATLAAKISTPSIFNGELEMIGADVLADVTLTSPVDVIRIIALETTADGDIRFPTVDAKVFATINLYRQALAQKLPGRVRTIDPVVP